MNCKNCGNTINEEDIYCGKCGTNIKDGSRYVEEHKEDFIDKLSKPSVIGKTFIVEGIIAIIVSIIIGITTNDKSIIQYLLPLSIGFIFLGLCLTSIFKQNLYISATIIGIVIGTILLFYVPLASISGYLVALLAFIKGKSLNQFKLYKNAKVKEKLTREELLNRCTKDLSNPNYPLLITVDKNCIVAKIDWKNTTRFTFTDISKEKKSFEYRVFLYENNTYREQINEVSSERNLNLTGASIEKSALVGISLRDYGSIEFGINNNNGEKGIITTKLNVEDIRNKIRTYVEEHGFKYTS